MKKKEKKIQSRVGGSKVTPRQRATASTAGRITKLLTPKVRHRVTPKPEFRPLRRPVPREEWATMAATGVAYPSICLWGDQQSAIEGCDPDEVVCLVRLEVLEVLDE